jgi:hypothetical protein
MLVVFADGDEEKDDGDVFETVDPFLSFGTLTSDIEHSVGEVLDVEGCFGDTGRLDSSAQYVLVGGEIILL